MAAADAGADATLAACTAVAVGWATVAAGVTAAGLLTGFTLAGCALGATATALAAAAGTEAADAGAALAAFDALDGFAKDAAGADAFTALGATFFAGVAWLAFLAGTGAVVRTAALAGALALAEALAATGLAAGVAAGLLATLATFATPAAPLVLAGTLALRLLVARAGAANGRVVDLGFATLLLAACVELARPAG